MAGTTSSNKSTLNYSLMSDEAFESFKTAQVNVFKLSLAEKDLKTKTDELKSNYTDKKALSEALQQERTARNNALERANMSCVTAIMQYVKLEDRLEGNLYNFNLETFLQNIGVLKGSIAGLKTKQADRIEDLRQAVTDRHVNGYLRRKKADYMLSEKTSKDIKNTPVELMLALITAFVESGCFRINNGYLERVDFDKK